MPDGARAESVFSAIRGLDVYKRQIVGLEATRVTIRIRSTLVGRAGFEPARFSRRVTGLQPSGIDQLTHLPDVKELTRIYGWRKAGESNANVPGHTGLANQPGLPISHAFRAGNYQYNNDESG